MNVIGLVGWYDRADQDTPTYDPPHEGPCPVCGGALGPDSVRTVSVLYADGVRSLFYRLHRACGDRLTQVEEGRLDAAVLEYAGGMFN